MLKFFHGWRRKAGCVTLVLACVFAGGWTRTYFREDGLAVSLLHNSLDLYSTDGKLICTLYPRGPNFYCNWVTQSELGPWRLYYGSAFEWDFDKYGFGASKAHDSIILVLPYWSLIAPLTLLSTWLLLSKPRKPTEKPPAT